MYKIELNNKYSIGQEVYIIKNTSTNKLVCSHCGKYEFRYETKPVKTKVKGFYISSNVVGKNIKSTFTYYLSGYSNMNEKDVYESRKEAETECERRRKKGLL